MFVICLNLFLKFVLLPFCNLSLCNLPNKHFSYHIFGTIGKPSMWKGVRYQVHTWANKTCYTSMIIVKIAKVLKLSIKSCLIGWELHPSFDASSFFKCCLQNHEILLNKGVKYWDFGLNGPSLNTFIARVRVLEIVIGWRHLGKERIGQTQFNTKIVTKLNFMPCWSPMFFFFWCFLTSHPLHNQKGFNAIFASLYGQLYYYSVHLVPHFEECSPMAFFYNFEISYEWFL
jgi:hypothetical protein